MELQKIEKPVFYDGWNFDASNKILIASVKEWRQLTENVLSECFLVYKHLRDANNEKKGTYKQGEKVTYVTLLELPTFKEWSESVGISHMTFYRHFKKLGWIEPKVEQIEYPPHIQEILDNPDISDSEKQVMIDNHRPPTIPQKPTYEFNFVVEGKAAYMAKKHLGKNAKGKITKWLKAMEDE